MPGEFGRACFQYFPYVPDAHQHHVPSCHPSQTPVLSLQLGAGAEPHGSQIIYRWQSESLWAALLCIYFSAALLHLSTPAAGCSCLWRAGRWLGTLLHRFGWWSALFGDSQERYWPLSCTAAQTEDGFYFSEHIRSSSTAWCSAFCQRLQAACQGGVRSKLKCCSNFLHYHSCRKCHYLIRLCSTSRGNILKGRHGCSLRLNAFITSGLTGCNVQ